jgi:predicted ATPase
MGGELEREARYERIRRAGAGSYGAVFEARDRETGSRVALKVLRGAPEASIIARFRREAEVLSSLAHPSIVKAHGYGTTEGGDPFVVLEWLEGEPLADRLRQGPLTIEETLTVGTAVASALEHAHALGIVHRDIKPSNLFLQEGLVERLRVIDFGIALLAAGANLTESGAALGTPGYMAPEQAKGEPDIDARADLYSLGCVIYACLAGRPPFVADRAVSLLLQVVLNDAPPVTEHRPDVPPELAALVMRLLSRERSERPARASEVVAQLRRFDAGGGPPSSAAPALTRTEIRHRCIVVAQAEGGGFRPRSRRAEDLEELRAIATDHGAALDVLVDGTLLFELAVAASTQNSTREAAPSGAANAQDAARAAARAAFAIVEAVPEAYVAIVSARGGHGHAAGDALSAAIERGADLLSKMRSAGVRGRPAADEVTAGLIETHVKLDAVDALRVLVADRSVEDAARPLLGQATPCVGRELELAWLEQATKRFIGAKQPGIAMVVAPPGLGKSRLRHEFLRRWSRPDDVRLLAARCDPMTSDVPYGVAVELLRATLRQGGAEPASLAGALDALVASCLDGEIASRTRSFLAELLGVGALEGDTELEVARRNPLVMSDQIERAWEALFGALARTSPLLVVVEDYHDIDEPSARVIDRLVSTAQKAPLGVLGFGRPEVTGRLPALTSSRHCQIHRMAGLSKAAALRLARTVLGDAVDQAALLRAIDHARGNAFYLEELIRALAQGKTDLPETVMAMAESRLEALDDEARRVLRAASIFGIRFWLGGLTRLLGSRAVARDLSSIVGGLEAAEVVTRAESSRYPGEEELSFRHALLRDVVYATLTEEDRALGHALAAEWLEAMNEHDALVVATHFDRAGNWQRAVPWLVRAAQQALDANDLEGAIKRAERAVACGATSEVLGRAQLLKAEAHNWRGEYQKERASAAVALAELPRGSEEWARAARCLGRASGITGDVDELSRIAEELFQLSQENPSRTALHSALLICAMRLFFAGRYAEGERILKFFDRTLPLAEEARATLHAARGTRAAFAGDFAEQRAQYARAIEISTLVGDLRFAAQGRVNMAHATNLLGRYEEAERALREALPTAQRYGLGRVAMAIKNNLAEALEGLGKLDEACEVARAAIDEALAQGDKRLGGGSIIHLGRALLSKGDVDAAEAELRRAADMLEASKPLLAYALGVLSHARLARGDAVAALDTSTAAMALMAELGDVEEGEATIRLGHALALEKNGRVEEARMVVLDARDRLLERADKITDPELCASFLSRVRDNQRTIQLAERWEAGTWLS